MLLTTGLHRCTVPCCSYRPLVFMLHCPLVFTLSPVVHIAPPPGVHTTPPVFTLQCPLGFIPSPGVHTAPLVFTLHCSTSAHLKAAVPSGVNLPTAPGLHVNVTGKC